MAEQTNEMSFWGHLDVLRGILFKIAAVVIVLGIGAFIIMPWFFDHDLGCRASPCRTISKL